MGVAEKSAAGRDQISGREFERFLGEAQSPAEQLWAVSQFEFRVWADSVRWRNGRNGHAATAGLPDASTGVGALWNRGNPIEKIGNPGQTGRRRRRNATNVG